MSAMKQTLVASAIATMGLAYASGAAAQLPQGDWEANGVLTVTNSAQDTFVCQVALYGRQTAFNDGTQDWDGVIHALRAQNSQQAPQPIGTLCGGSPNFGPLGQVHGVRGVFPAPDYHWPYRVVGGVMTIDDVEFSVGIPSPGCGPGTVTATWTNGDADFADGDFTFADIDNPVLSGTNNCTMVGRLKMHFKVGKEY